MVISEAVIRIEIGKLDHKGTEEALKESLCEYLRELIEDNNLEYEIESWKA